MQKKGKGNELFLGTGFPSSGLNTEKTVPGEEVAMSS